MYAMYSSGEKGRRSRLGHIVVNVNNEGANSARYIHETRPLCGAVENPKFRTITWRR